MTRAMRSKVMAATALVVAGSMLGCAASVPAGPIPAGPAGAVGPGGVAPGAIAPSDMAATPAGPDATRIPAMVGDGGAAMKLQVPGSAPTVAIPERGEPVIPAETLKFRAPINSLEDVLKQSDLGPVPESQAPTPDMIKKILPQKLSQAQAASLLVKVPADMVQAAALDDMVQDGGLPAGGGSISASSHGRDSGDDYSRFRRPDSSGYGSGDKRGPDVSYSRGGKGRQGQVGGSHGKKGKHKRTRWSNWGGFADPDFYLASGWGWNNFIYGGSYFFFPATIFGALHFFPYTYASGFFYPAYCPFYFSAAFFFPYCQTPLVWFGTFGLVSGCPTCPISGRPLLWFPGEVPII